MKIKDIENIGDVKVTKGKLIKWFLITVVSLTIMGFVISSLGLFTKVISTPARVLSKTLGTDNVIQSYEWFFDVDAAYKARFNQVTQYKKFLNSETDKGEKYRIRTELAAMQQTCRDLATKYNANSQKMNKSIFKGWELPERLSYKQC